MYYYTVRLFFHLCRRNVDKKEKYEETEEEKNRREIKKKRRCDGNANERGRRREIKDVFALIVCLAIALLPNLP